MSGLRHIKPPCSFVNEDGSISHYLWASSLFPDVMDTSEDFVELVEKDGHVRLVEYTRITL